MIGHDDRVTGRACPRVAVRSPAVVIDAAICCLTPTSRMVAVHENEQRVLPSFLQHRRTVKRCPQLGRNAAQDDGIELLRELVLGDYYFGRRPGQVTAHGAEGRLDTGARDRGTQTELSAL